MGMQRRVQHVQVVLVKVSVLGVRIERQQLHVSILLLLMLLIPGMMRRVMPLFVVPPYVLLMCIVIAMVRVRTFLVRWLMWRVMLHRVRMMLLLVLCMQLHRRQRVHVRLAVREDGRCQSAAVWRVHMRSATGIGQKIMRVRQIGHGGRSKLGGWRQQQPQAVSTCSWPAGRSA